METPKENMPKYNTDATKPTVLWRYIASCIGSKILKDPKLYIYCLAQSLLLLAMYIPLDFLPELMVRKHNISHIRAGYTITLFGVGTIFGRIAPGIITSCVKNSSMVICVSNVVFLGIGSLLYVFCETYIHFDVLSGINGIFFGAAYVVIPLTLLDLFGVEAIRDTYGMVMLFCLVTVTFGIPLVGKLIHIYGEVFAFSATSGLYFTTALLCFLVLFLHCNKIKSSKSNNI